MYFRIELNKGKPDHSTIRDFYTCLTKASAHWIDDFISNGGFSAFSDAILSFEVYVRFFMCAPPTSIQKSGQNWEDIWDPSES